MVKDASNAIPVQIPHNPSMRPAGPDQAPANSEDAVASHLDQLRKEYHAQPGQNLNDAIRIQSFDNAQARQAEWAMSLGGQPGDDPKALLVQSHADHHKLIENEFCSGVAKAVSHGATPQHAYAAMLSKAGFAEGTKFACAPVDTNLQPHHGVAIDATAAQGTEHRR